MQRQLRAEPPVHARRASADHRPPRRGGRRPRRRHRLPPHRLREEHGARRRGGRRSRTPSGSTTSPSRTTSSSSCSRSRSCSSSRRRAKAAWMRTLLCELNRIHSHLVWLGTVGARARRDLDVLVRVPRARHDPRPVRDRHRRPHAHALLPGRRPRRGHPAGLLPRVPQVRRVDAEGGRRLRDAARDRNAIWLERTSGLGAPLGRRRDRARPVRPGAARVGRRLGPPQARSRTSPTPRSTSTCPVYPNGDVYDRYRVHMDEMRESTRIVAQCLDRLERHGGRAVDRGRPQGRAAAARGAAHLDGVADPPLQDRHRGLPRPRGRGLRRDRVAARRARLLRRLRRRPEAVARQVPGAVVRRARGDGDVHDATRSSPT